MIYLFVDFVGYSITVFVKQQFRSVKWCTYDLNQMRFSIFEHSVISHCYYITKPAVLQYFSYHFPKIFHVFYAGKLFHVKHSFDLGFCLHTDRDTYSNYHYTALNYKKRPAKSSSYISNYPMFHVKHRMFSVLVQ